MAKNRNGISGLVNALGSPKMKGLSLASSLKPTAVTGSSSSSAARFSKPPSAGDVKTLSLSGKDTAIPINFGRPSNSKTATTKSSNALTNLLTQSASGGVGSAFTNGLSSIAGLGGLFSSIVSSFGGGKSTPPPLVDFQLPNSISQTMYVSSKNSMANSTANQGVAVEQASTSGVTGSINSTQQMQYQSAAIAQAVKTAILNSSSLNDVIAEI